MSATFTPVPRRTFGLNRVAFVIRCRLCRWRTEVGTAYQANAMCNRHECEEAA
jgi:hypothetical protein